MHFLYYPISILFIDYLILYGILLNVGEVYMVKKIIIACTLVCMTTMVSSVSLKTVDKGQQGSPCK